MSIGSGARIGLGIALLWLALLQTAGAAEIKLTDFSAQEDSKRVTLKFTFSEPVKPDVTSFFTHNYVGMRAAGLKFTKRQLSFGDLVPPSKDAERVYRFVRFVQDNESGEIRVYLTKPLTPQDAQVVPYDTYTEVTILKPQLAAGEQKPEEVPEFKPNVEEVQPSAPMDSPSIDAQNVDEPVEQPVERNVEDAPPTLRSGSLEPSNPPSHVEPEVESPEPVESKPQPTVEKPEPADEPEVTPLSPQTPARIGGPSYTDFDLEQVPINQLVFKGKPFREAILELVAGTGYNVVVADDVDNSDVFLNFTQKKLSLKSALDLLALSFDLQWSLQPDAIVVKAKPAQ